MWDFEILQFISDKKCNVLGLKYIFSIILAIQIYQIIDHNNFILSSEKKTECSLQNYLLIVNLLEAICLPHQDKFKIVYLHRVKIQFELAI